MDVSTTPTSSRWKPGQSGNPAGRPAGTGHLQKARLELQCAWDGEQPDGADGIRAKLIEKAKAGDMLAIKIIAERVLPPMKPTEDTAQVELDGATVAQKAEAVLVSLARGEMPLAQARELMDGLAALAKIVDLEEIKHRLEEVERLTQERRP